MAKDTIYEPRKPAVQEVTAGQVRMAIRKFRDYSQDLEFADYNTFEDRVRVFVNFCQKDPVFLRIRSQLLNNPNVDFEDWLENGASKGTGMAGSGSLNFPVEEDDRLALMYQLVEAAANPKYAIIERGTYWFAVGSSSIDDYIRAFSDAVMRPLFRDLGYKLDEIEERLPVEGSERISAQTLQIITNTGTFLQQIAVGENIRQVGSVSGNNEKMEKLFNAVLNEIEREPTLTSEERNEARDVATAAQAEALSAKPRGSVVKALLTSLPKAISTAKTVMEIIQMFNQPAPTLS